jgi:hypothetical protein
MTSANGQWLSESGAHYGYLPVPGRRRSRSERMSVVLRGSLQVAGLTIKIALGVIAVPLLIIFVVSMIGVIFFRAP